MLRPLSEEEKCCKYCLHFKMHKKNSLLQRLKTGEKFKDYPHCGISIKEITDPEHHKCPKFLEGL